MRTTVLLISEHPSDARLIRELLAEAERQATHADTFDLVSVDSLSGGLERLTRGGVGAVLVDEAFCADRDEGGLSEIQVCAPHVPVVVLANADDQDLAVQFLRQGVQDHVPRAQLDSHMLPRVLSHAIARLRATLPDLSGSTLDHASDACTVYDLISDLAYMLRVEPDGTLVLDWVNEAFVRQLGLDVNGVTARGGWDSLIHPGDAPHMEALTTALLSGQPAAGEFRIISGDGQTYWVLSYGRPVWDGAHERVVRVYGVAQDITERKRAQVLLADSLAQVERAKQEWESTADSLPQLILILDSQGRVARANRIVEEWGLRSIKDIQGQQLHQLLHPGCEDEACELRTFSRAAFEALRAGQISTSEYEDRTLGRRLSLQVRPIAAPRAGTGQDHTSFAVAVVDDITERRRAVEALRQRTAQLQARNEELDAFAHTVAHDLKNPISLIVGFADILRQYRENMSEADIEGHLDTIVQNGLKTISIIDELLLLAGARQVQVTLGPVDMAPIVDSVMRRLAMVIREAGAEIVLPSDWPAAVGYAPWVEEVWANYVSNAIKYGGHPPRVELGATRAPSGLVRFWVRDNGPGLEPGDRERLFEPFERLDTPPAPGHGLGLSIVKQIMQKMDGQVGVESRPGEGSEFYFALPTAASG